jgi:ribosomal protein S27E
MSSSNWWANKMGTSAPVPPTPPVSVPQTPVYNPVPQQPQEPPRLPQSAVAASRCPGCGSGNYGSSDPNTKARCYDCGYPIQQSGSGLGTGITGNQASGPAQPARQISKSNNWNPQNVDKSFL